MDKAAIGIVGGAGYTAGELIRLLVNHPWAEIAWVHSSSMAGRSVADVHQDLVGETGLVFTDALDFSKIDVLFLCMGHGASVEFLAANAMPDGLKIIDLSQDFRLADPSHTFVYGLPEVQKKRIREATRIANPGCFATAIQLGLLPLAQAGWLRDEVHIHGITGSTGAGQRPTDTGHFSWRNNNVSVYKPFRHQHLQEITQSVKSLQPDFNHALNFIPVRGNFTRGIFVTQYTTLDVPFETVRDQYQRFYQEAPFVTVTDVNPHLKQVVNTNKGVVYLEEQEDKILIISMIDNLLKGASGQAVQNMNLMMGWEETAGLRLKAGYF